MAASIFLDASGVVEHGTIAAGLGSYAFPDNSPGDCAPRAWLRGYVFPCRVPQLVPYDRGDDGANHGRTAALGGIPWFMIGCVSTWLLTFAWSYNPLLAPALFMLAALWVSVPVRMRALVYCHLTVPLAPSGWKADRDCVWYGIRIGASCVVTCSFLMLACAFTGHNLVAMLGAAALGLIERRSFRPPTHPIFVGTLLVAFWFLYR